jgi:hypothetical protein
MPHALRFPLHALCSMLYAHPSPISHELSAVLPSLLPAPCSMLNRYELFCFLKILDQYPKFN